MPGREHPGDDALSAGVGVAGIAPGGPGGETLPRLFYARVDHAPDGVSSHSPVRDGAATPGALVPGALVPGWAPTRWRETRAAVEELAMGLVARGIARGDRIAIVSQTRREWSQLDLAAQVVGAVTVGLYPSLPAHEAAAQLAHADARLVFVEDAAQAAKLDRPGVAPRIVIDGDAREVSSSFEAFRAEGRAHLARSPEEPRRRALEARPDDRVTFVYTSGTTGDAKGVVLTHANFTYVLGATLRRVPYGGQRVLAFLPLAHALQRYASYLALVADLDAFYGRGLDTVADDLQRVGPTAFAAVPRILEKIHGRVLEGGRATTGLRRRVFEATWPAVIARGHAALGGAPLGGGLAARAWLGRRIIGRRLRARLGGGLRFVGCGSAPLPGDVHALFEGLGIPVLEGWGLSETTAPVTIAGLDRRKLGSVGRPLDGTEVRVAADGELLVRGPGVFAGYHDDAAATRAAFDDEGWFRTGDIGHVDADGFVFITDRKKELIVTAGGKNVAPQPLEQALRLDPLVGVAVVVGDRRPCLVALLALEPEVAALEAEALGLASADPEALARHPAIRARLDARVAAVNATRAPYTQVKAWAVLPAAPSIENGELTPTLKVRRRVIEANHAARIEAMYRGLGL